ncbi:MAG: hypothetical protein IT373_25220 [Polyangiaceae bacterium]|nr:hypothetical protein [Polyangiaceae bacterium]
MSGPRCRANAVRASALRAGVSLALLALAPWLVGCGAAQYDYVRPWFRVATSPRYVLAPHAIEWGGLRSAETRVDGRWHELAREGVGRGTFRVHRVGDAVALDQYAAVPDEPRSDPRTSGRVAIYHEGRLAPVVLPHSACASPRFSEQPPELTCFGCGEAEPYEPVPLYDGTLACGTLHLESYDTFGRSLARRALASPAECPEVEGRLPTGEWIVADTAQSNDDFLYFGAPRTRFRLDPGGFTRLPFGADPLGIEHDAEGRAQEILRQVPIRDVAVASLRAAFEDEERTRPDWVRESELVHHLRRGQALEPDVPVHPGDCYTVVARSTADLSGLRLGVWRAWPDITVSLAHFDDPPLARSVGASTARLTHCVGPGEPPLLEVHVEATAGAGYIVARIYAHPPG